MPFPERKRKKHKSNQIKTAQDTTSSNYKTNPRKRTPETHQRALDLSQELRKLSNQKRLRECLGLYNSTQYDDIRDAHHGSIVIDCCARCGDMDEAERVVSSMLGHSLEDTTEEYIWEKYDTISCKRMPIQAWTALLKGYAHGGMMAKADSLFSALCYNQSDDESENKSKKRKRTEPKNDCTANIRTLNTLLRGCLWSATSINPDVKKSVGEHRKKKKNLNRRVLRNEQVGGIATAERAWELFNKIIQKKKDTAYDSSSYEYYITLLCQSLQYEKAELRVKQMKEQFDLSNDMRNTDPSVVESLVVCLVALARAYALLGKVEDVQRCTAEALKMIKILNSSGEKEQNKKGNNITTGGKQGWKSNADTDEKGRREQSNTLFRSHRVSELETEATALGQYFTHGDENCLAKTMATRLLYFSGGGTTSLNAIADINSDSNDINSCQSVQQTSLQWYNSLWISFGLKAATQLLDGMQKVHGSQMQVNAALSHDMCTTLRRKLLGKDHHIITTKGYIDFAQVFSPIKGKSVGSHDAPLHIELGSGSGDWGTIQAESNPSDNYLTVELRADRVAQTFAKVVLRNTINNQTRSILPNLCCVGSECGSFLKERIQPETIKTIFVNHPEPPTQTSTTDDEQAHMLNSETIMTAAKCLLQNGEGRIVVVTDNLIYAKLIGHTMAKVLNQAKLTSLKPNEVSDLRKIETLSNPNKYGAFVHIYEGKPSLSIGHYTPKANSGTSYFDRLWRTGAGKHADMKKRYIIAVRTIGGEHKVSTNSKNKNSAQSNQSRGAANKNNKKKSAEKQQRRNERRLMKKQQLQQQHLSKS